MEVLTPFLRRLQTYGPEIERQATQSGLALLAAAGLQLTELADPQARIPHSLGVALLEDGIRISGDPAHGLHAGAGKQPGDGGILEHLTNSAATLRESTLTAQRYLPLSYGGAQIMLLEDDSNIAVWRYKPPPGIVLPAACSDYVVSTFLKSAQCQLGFAARPLEIRMIHDEPSYAAEYERVLGTRVRFGHAYNEMLMPRAALDLPIVSANAGLHALLKRYADELLARVALHNPFTGRVSKLIHKRLSQGITLTDVARTLGISERTVRRRLADEGTTHSELVDAARHELALRLLGEADQDIAEISFALGFAHPTAFNRAFRRWHDVAPSEFVKQRPSSAFHQFYRGRSRSE